MSHTYVNAMFHCVFSTKGRRRLITADLQERLWPFMGGIVREQGLKALTIGGVEDHVHLLLSMSATISIAQAIQSIKGASSKWVRDTFPEHRSFAWQEGYGAFSIGVSQSDAMIAYIRSQPEHHRETTFQEEFRMFLQKHGIQPPNPAINRYCQPTLRVETPKFSRYSSPNHERNGKASRSCGRPRFRPEGTHDNSPAVHCWGEVHRDFLPASPVGTTEMGASTLYSVGVFASLLADWPLRIARSLRG